MRSGKPGADFPKFKPLGLVSVPSRGTENMDNAFVGQLAYGPKRSLHVCRLRSVIDNYLKAQIVFLPLPSARG